jgi:hypothetical protein
MNFKLKAVAIAALLGTASVAAAQNASPVQTRAQSFAEQFRQMQTLNSTSPYTFKPTPALGIRPDDPVGNERFAQRFADMQAASSTDEFAGGHTVYGDSQNMQAADPVGSEGFADRFAQMQAASSNSGEYAFHPGSNVLSDEANSTLVAGKAIGSTLPKYLANAQK